MIGSGFYWFLAEFYLVAAMLKLYLNTLAETGLVKNDERAYIVVYVVSVFLAVAMAGVYGRLLRDPVYVGFLLTMAFIFAGLLFSPRTPAEDVSAAS